jgi:hypothetical protein
MKIISPDSYIYTCDFYIACKIGKDEWISCYFKTLWKARLFARKLQRQLGTIIDLHCKGRIIISYGRCGEYVTKDGRFQYNISEYISETVNDLYKIKINC